MNKNATCNGWPFLLGIIVVQIANAPPNFTQSFVSESLAERMMYLHCMPITDIC